MYVHFTVYLCKKLGKISVKRGGGLILRHGRILRILRYTPYVAMLDCTGPGQKASVNALLVSLGVPWCPLGVPWCAFSEL